MQDLDVFERIVRKRRSVRGFKSETVPQEVMNSVFELAQTAPSGCNTQPWHVYVASGKTCERLREEYPRAIAANEYQMDFPFSGKYEGAYKERQFEAATLLYQAMGIDRGDKKARQAAMMRNFSFFGAPHVAFLFMEECFSIREALDVGLYAQNLMLSLTAHGIASCPQTALSFNAKLVRDCLAVPTHMKLLLGISFGYEEPKVSANNCRTERISINHNIHFVG